MCLINFRVKVSNILFQLETNSNKTSQNLEIRHSTELSGKVQYHDYK